MGSARRDRLVRVGWAALALIALAGAVYVATRASTRGAARRAVRLTLAAPSGVYKWKSPTLSPDGRYIAFLGLDSADVWKIWVAPIDGTAPRPIPGTDGAGMPVWSPDSRFIEFGSRNKVKTVAVFGGEPVTICDEGLGDGSWGVSGTVLLDIGGMPGNTIQAVPAVGGEARQVTWIDGSRSDIIHSWPEFLPGGKHFLYQECIAHNPDSTTLRVGRLGSRESKALAVGRFSRVRYAPPGYLLYVRGRTFLAQPFDTKRLRLTGDALTVVDDVLPPDGFGNAEVSVSANGTLVYQHEVPDWKHQLTWVDRAGKRLGTLGPPAVYRSRLALSPDGQRVAVPIVAPGDRTPDLWVIDASRNMPIRITSAPLEDWNPAWSADGRTLYFQRGDSFSDTARVWEKSASGLGRERVLALPGFSWPLVTSRNGRILLVGYWSPEKNRAPSSGVTGANPMTDWDVGALSLGPGESFARLLTSDFSENDAVLSPDGRWMAYQSRESGELAVYVVDYPGLSSKWRISTETAASPQWSGDGRELYYRGLEDGRVRSVRIATAPVFRAGKPICILQDVKYLWQYAATADPNRFLVMERVEDQSPPPFQVVLNWPSLTRRR